MNDFSQYQQQLQMQRMMQMQQARMQQMQQMQQNSALFGQQQAAFAAATTPLGTVGGGAFSGGVGQGAGGPRQSFLGLGLAATGGFGVLGTENGLFGTGIGNQLNFRFNDNNRLGGQLRAQQDLEGVKRGIGRDLMSSGVNALGLGFLNRRFGLAGQSSVVEDSLGVMNSFSGIRGATESRVGGVGVSRGFAVDRLANIRGNISGRFKAMGDEEVRTLSNSAMDSLSLTQRTAMAQGTAGDADKTLEKQVDLLKTIVTNTKMQVQEAAELVKVAKGQSTGNAAALVARSSELASNITSSTDMTRGQLANMSLGFRGAALDMGASAGGADRMQSHMMAAFDRTMARINSGDIDSAALRAYGGSTPEEQARNRVLAMAQQGSRFSQATTGTMGLLDDPMAAMRGGMAGFVGAQAQAVGSDPFNAMANAKYSDRGIARGDARTAAGHQMAIAQGDMTNQMMGGRLNEASLIGLYAEQMGITDPRQARDQYRANRKATGELSAAFGADFDAVSSTMSTQSATTLNRFNTVTGHNGTAGVLRRMGEGASYGDAMSSEFSLNSGNLRQNVIGKLSNVHASELLLNLDEKTRKRVEGILGSTTKRGELLTDPNDVGDGLTTAEYSREKLRVDEYLKPGRLSGLNEADRNAVDRSLMKLSQLTVVNDKTAPDGSVGRELNVIVSNIADIKMTS